MNDDMKNSGHVDRDSPAYEAARGRIASYLMRIGSEDPRNGFTEKAERLLRSDLDEIPSWVAIDLLARLSTPSPDSGERMREAGLRADVIAARRWLDDRDRAGGLGADTHAAVRSAVKVLDQVAALQESAR